MSRDLVLARTMLRDIVRYSCTVGLLKQIPFRLPKLPNTEFDSPIRAIPGMARGAKLYWRFESDL